MAFNDAAKSSGTYKLNMKQENPFMPSNTCAKSRHKYREHPLEVRAFPGSASKSALAFGTDNCWRDSAPPGLSTKSLSVSQKDKKRAPWDIRGKFEDAKALNHYLNEEIEILADKEVNLMKDTAKLEVDLKKHSEDIERDNKKIEELKQKLRDVTNKVNVAKKERDEVLLSGQRRVLKLTKKNAVLKSNVASMEMKSTNLSNSLVELRSENTFHKMLMSQPQSELMEKREELVKVAAVNKALKLQYKQKQQTNQELETKIKALSNAKI